MTKIQEPLAQSSDIRQLGTSRFLYSYSLSLDKSVLPILSGGGSGHEPAHFGYIGQGMLAGAIAGEIFIPPTATEILEAFRFLDKGKGVFVIIKNFQADLAVFQEAIESARKEGIAVRYVVSHDDISVEGTAFKRRHRGVAGTLFLHKILGHAAQNGGSLEEIEQLALGVASHIATLGVASKAATSPVTNKAMFDLQDGFISYGVGIHGEAGYKTVPHISTEKLAIELCNKLKMFFRWKKGQRFAILVNNLGNTAHDEEELFLSHVLDLMELEGLNIDFVASSKLMTSLDMEGLSLSMLELTDPSWIHALQAPTDAPAWPL
nr:DhaKLM operon coactivator DhaQ [Streptococcus sp. X13SY08]